MLRKNGTRQPQIRNPSPAIGLTTSTAKFARTPAGAPNCGHDATNPRCSFVRAHSIESSTNRPIRRHPETLNEAKDGQDRQAPNSDLRVDGTKPRRRSNAHQQERRDQRAFVFARGAGSSQRSSSERCLSITPGQNWEQLFLCDGVRGGRVFLEQLIKRSGRVEVELALEITTQLVVGLAAVHKQKLVHRDIKPSNIMVSFEEGGGPMVKIIDLGLAKLTTDLPAEAAISTPEFLLEHRSSPVPSSSRASRLSIRSDLYSLGVTLWELMTGKAPFQGTSAEVMYQHLHAPLAIEQLEGIPQPVVARLEVLLEKDPNRRFQSPAELLRALPTKMALSTRKDNYSSEPAGDAPYHFARRTSQADNKIAPKKISVAELPITGSQLFGREEDIAFLNGAWANPKINIVTIVAWAGVGKSTLINHWLRANGCPTLSFCGARLWLVLLQTRQQRAIFVRR